MVYQAPKLINELVDYELGLPERGTTDLGKEGGIQNIDCMAIVHMQQMQRVEEV